MKKSILGALLMLAASQAFAQVTVSDAWVRATVPQQQASGAFMELKSATDAKLVGASSDVAGVVQVHQMKMDGNVMKMSEVQGGLDLPAGKTVKLTPGSYHVMMMGLKHQLKAGDVVPITLVVQQADGKRENIEVKAPVRPLNAPANGNAHGGMSGMSGMSGMGGMQHGDAMKHGDMGGMQHDGGSMKMNSN